MTKSEYNRKYYEAHKEKLKADGRAYYQRTIDARRAYDRARYPKRRASDLARHKANYPLVKEHKRLYQIEWNKRNAERLKQRARTYRKENLGKILARNYAYVKANRAKANLWSKNWRIKNPGKFTALDARRRARMSVAVTDKRLVDEFFQWVHNQDFVTCTYCHRYISGRQIEIDHIIPISKGGAHLPDNFCVSCRSCNASKNDRTLMEWPQCPAWLEPLRKEFSICQ
jgi:5-methylcytosine-specific restriction endonuclease McrA